MDKYVRVKIKKKKNDDDDRKELIYVCIEIH